MFLARRPSADAIDRFLRESQDLPLLYRPIGIVGTATDGWAVDEATAVIGHGQADYERARTALLTWTHFNLGWVETFPRHAPVGVGTIVAVLIRHLGFWSLNGTRVVYEVGSRTEGSHFGFAYGTLMNHAESGEELFEVFIDPRTGYVVYRLRAASRPRAALAWLGAPVVRALQARFRRDSSCRDDPSDTMTVAVVPAAGASTRFGTMKLLADVGARRSSNGRWRPCSMPAWREWSSSRGPATPSRPCRRWPIRG